MTEEMDISPTQHLLEFCPASYWQSLDAEQLIRWINAVAWYLDDDSCEDLSWTVGDVEIEFTGSGRAHEDFEHTLFAAKDLYKFLCWASQRLVELGQEKNAECDIKKVLKDLDGDPRSRAQLVYLRDSHFDGFVEMGALTRPGISEEDITFVSNLLAAEIIVGQSLRDQKVQDFVRDFHKRLFSPVQRDLLSDLNCCLESPIDENQFSSGWDWLPEGRQQSYLNALEQMKEDKVVASRSHLIIGKNAFVLSILKE